MKIQAHHRLPVFIALSLAIHMAWFINNQSWTLHRPHQDSSPMTVYIKESRVNYQAKQNSLSTAKSPQRKPSGVEKNITEHLSQPEQKPKVDQANANRLASAKIIGHVKYKLVQHFVYPTLARHKGWQGQVLLGFEVDGAGRIQKIHIKKSSGYSILDESAISALNKIGKIGFNAIGLIKQSWQLEIPVIYRLEG